MSSRSRRHVSRAVPAAFVAILPAALLAGDDAAGRVEYDLDAGVWSLAAVSMQRAPADSGVDWESTWASLTFHLEEESTP